MKTIDITGRVFSRLKVLEKGGVNKHKQLMWLCKCNCGTTKLILGQSLIHGRSKSCGCLARERVSAAISIHKLSTSPLYKVFYAMKQRCFNSNNKQYHYYGGKGVTIYKNWLDNFLEFHTWALENGYKEGLSIDRIDNNGNYEPSNCRWATSLEQTNNQNSNIHIKYNGEIMTLSQASRKSGICYATLHSRVINKCSQEKLFNTPRSGKRRKLDSRGL